MSDELVKRALSYRQVLGRWEVDGQPVIGNPVKLTDEAIDKIVQFVQAGNYMQIAMAASGFNPGSYSRWAQQANKVAHMYPELDLEEWPEGMIPPDLTIAEWQAYKLMSRLVYAEAQAEAFAVLQVKKHMPEQWTAAMTYLERRFPERWRKRQTIESEIKTGDGLDENAILDDPRAVALVHEALERMAEDKPQLESGLIIDAEVEAD